MCVETLYQAYQPLLFSLAYRMLGSVMDSEDIVQEAFIAFNQLPNRETIENKKAYLCKIVTNRCLDLIRSSAKTREVYVGPWLPEPLLEKENPANDPSQAFLQQESISTAYLLLLQQLNANERAVFLLREAFHYSYDEIAEILDKSSANCRQIFHRAKKSMDFTPDQQPSVTIMESKIKEFVHSFLNGDITQILELVSEDIAMYSDGGGKVPTARVPIFGAEGVIRLLQNLMKMYADRFTFSFATFNGSPGLTLTTDNNLKYVYTFAFNGNRIQTIYIVGNPDKLRHLP
ncbi:MULTISPECIES: RNA polymerase sigma-70 factor [Neobacillus]|uniref:RNA polymerase sigma-70 factor n=1 Tax=Neobacillus rhizophilus TaxID=2833579 RepID=A0A942U1B7_9BACI|nr:MULTISPECIES: RNA polymerase sigma-70 factor [Neobacillus]MBS4212751.1 RNA polymerase sigma-70 factor [Neobacillus rhizophilus]MBU8915181.1 RNA polymerase sigma-70 factor [Bacillus sp. FJAT-29953]